ELRKQLREMRDHWWWRCEQAQHGSEDAGIAQKVDDLQTAVLHGQKRNEEVVAEVKAMMLQLAEQVQQRIMTAATLDGVFNAAGGLGSGLSPAPSLSSSGAFERFRTAPGFSGG